MKFICLVRRRTLVFQSTRPYLNLIKSNARCSAPRKINFSSWTFRLFLFVFLCSIGFSATFNFFEMSRFALKPETASIMRLESRTIALKFWKFFFRGNNRREHNYAAYDRAAQCNLPNEFLIKKSFELDKVTDRRMSNKPECQANKWPRLGRNVPFRYLSRTLSRWNIVNIVEL